MAQVFRVLFIVTAGIVVSLPDEPLTLCPRVIRTLARQQVRIITMLR